MTTPTEPTPSNEPDETTEPEPRLRKPGDLIAAVPALLGFIPVRSLVVTVLRPEPGVPLRAAVDFMTRMDLDGNGRAATAELIDRIAQICVAHNALAVLALIIDDRATAPKSGHRGVRGRKHRDLLAAIEHRLDAEAIPLAGAWAVAEIGPDLPWWSLTGPPRDGRQPDPATSEVALRQVLEGRLLRASREELAALVAPDPSLQSEMRPLLKAVGSTASGRFAEALRRDDADSYTRTTLRQVLRHVAKLESGIEPDPPALAELAVALRDSSVRDVMFALTPGPHAAAAEALWSRLTRALPDPDRAEAAALLAYCAYVRGDGPFTGVALEAALSADPEHRMAILLDAGLQTGMRPERLSRLADSGREAALDLGIDLDQELS
ncbi:DUF4192 domain-containing protein [Nocardia sp. NPDC088792]|uniref:DUF4192 domain-containing protein n=1 Tax=Nocardia sp. NPDC088792 TaxID=3364332 RepID=UPI00381E6134